MAFFQRENHQFSIAKETTRGTPEAAPTRFLFVDPDSTMDYSVELLDDSALAAQVGGEFAPVVGRKSGKGSMSLDLESKSIGEAIYSLLGSYTGTQVGTTTAYTHTFSVLTNSTQHPSYTIFANRGVEVHAYALSVAKAIEFSGDASGRAKAKVEWLFKTQSTTTTTAVSPTLAAKDPLMFYHADVKVDTVSIGARVGKWSLKIDNQAEALWLYNQSQDCSDIVVAKRPVVEGGFDMYFTSTSERADFLAGTSRRIDFDIIGSLITGSSYNRLIATMYNCRYTSIPFDGALEGGLFGASVAFKAYYSISDSKALQIVVGNQSTTY